MLANHGIRSVAVEGFQASRVIISYTDDTVIAGRFAQAGLRPTSGSGVLLICDDGDDFKTSRIGLFGLDKLHSVQDPERALEKVKK